ncbi:zinc finger protein, putative [Entamoeba invadens IP1]|uniref:Zinc finger protein, putative n=1 Tax=Entamoeba invadens IP1 TaxID=370355 RepID=A0A0A1UCZ9_ENTIV|nr:zinc finger protein, putative [Entamoeba invadens IP1]ELP94312.1 zinc finger protein, putative [Entamoeba invadens IP1]|eukprot:XP_004261083.1 zinc finger protein, putative [Entamoeba invadens IP1]
MQNDALTSTVNTIFTSFFHSKKLGKYVCTHEGCGKTFNSKKCLNVHMQTHNGEKPYTCPSCGMKFLRKHDCNVHLRIHTGEKPFQCETCHKRFARHSDLKVHEKVHSDVKPFLCPFNCGKCFKRKHDLKKHITFHVKHSMKELSEIVEKSEENAHSTIQSAFVPVNKKYFTVF